MQKTEFLNQLHVFCPHPKPSIPAFCCQFFFIISLQVTKLVSIWGLANEKLNGCASYMHIQKLNKFIRHGFIVVGWYLHPISLAMHDYISIDAHSSVATIIFGIET